jgi:broad specificity phosphatase PhoE
MIKTFFASLLLTCALAIGISAQNKTIVLVRHAEKETSEMTDKNEPPLTEAGKQRAERLAKIVKKYRPGAIYSTDFKRTRDTAGPIAKRRNLQVQTYDPKKPSDLVEAIMKSKTKRFLIVGHSNTIPGLANMLGKKELFKNLDDAEHGAIWIVRIKNGQVTKTEIIPY